MNKTIIYTASWLYNPGQPPIAGGAVAVRDGRVLATGLAKELMSQYSHSAVSFPGCVIMPGFVNAHTHLELTHFPSWRLRGGLDYHPRGFTDWVVQMVKVKRGVAQEEIPISLKDGIDKSLRAGNTAVGDILTNSDLLEIYRNSGITGKLYLELIGQDEALFMPRLEKSIQAASTYSAAQKAGVSPHAPYTLNSRFLPFIAEKASAQQLDISLHLAESVDECRFLFDSGGPLAEKLYPLVGWQQHIPSPAKTTPVGFFDSSGLLGPKTLAVHCVQITPNEALTLKQRGCKICLCPRSNERLAVGTAPVHLFKKEGIPLCLGTDSLASNDSLSLWDEARFAIDAYKGELGPDELLEMATAGGAAGIGLDAEVGALEPGKRADMQVVTLDGEFSAERLLAYGQLKEVFVFGEKV